MRKKGNNTPPITNQTSKRIINQKKMMAWACCTNHALLATSPSANNFFVLFCFFFIILVVGVCVYSCISLQQNGAEQHLTIHLSVVCHCGIVLLGPFAFDSLCYPFNVRGLIDLEVNS